MTTPLPHPANIVPDALSPSSHGTLAGWPPDYFDWVEEQVTGKRRSKSRLSKDLGFRPGYVGELLRRRKWPELDRLERIARFFSAPPDWVEEWCRQAIEYWESLSGAARALSLRRSGLLVAARVPCENEECNGTVLLADYTQGVRRCEQCVWTATTGVPPTKGARNNLARLIDSARKRQKMTRKQLSLHFGKSEWWFYSVRRQREWHPWRRDIEALAELLSLSPEDLVTCAGGAREDHYQSAEWQLRVQCLRLAQAADRAANTRGEYVGRAKEAGERGDMEELTRLHDELQQLPRRAHENVRKGAAKRRGTKHTNERRVKIGAATKRQWDGLSADERTRRIAVLESDQGRARRFLQRRLRDNANPSTDLLKRWKLDAATDLQIHPAAVWDYWLPILRRRKLVGSEGAPHKDHRFEVIDRLMAEWPRRDSGLLKDEQKLWDEAVHQLAAVEGPKVPTAQGVRRWWYTNRPRQGKLAPA